MYHYQGGQLYRNSYQAIWKQGISRQNRKNTEIEGKCYAKNNVKV